MKDPRRIGEGLAFEYLPVSTRGFDEAGARRFAEHLPGLEGHGADVRGRGC